MKARILRKFKDKHTKKIYIPGEEVDFTEERAKEILEKGKMIEEIGESIEASELEETKGTGQKKTTSRRTKKEE